MREQLRNLRQRRDFFVNFCNIKCRHLKGPKGKFVAKTRKYGQPTSSLWKPIIGAKFFLSNLLTFFACTPKRGFSSRVSDKRSGHFCACKSKNNSSKLFSPSLVACDVVNFTRHLKRLFLVKLTGMTGGFMSRGKSRVTRDRTSSPAESTRND